MIKERYGGKVKEMKRRGKNWERKCEELAGKAGEMRIEMNKNENKHKHKGE